MDAVREYILEQVLKRQLDIHTATEYLMAMESHENSVHRDSTAVVGMSAKIHQMRDIDDIWNELVQVNKESNQKNAVEEYDKQLSSNIFGMSDDNYSKLSCKQRLMLEEVFYALQDAGIPLANIRNRNVGVFCGNAASARSNSEVASDDIFRNSRGIANLISNIFKTHGPSMDDYDGNGSIYAPLHNALKCLNDQECDIAIVSNMEMDVPENEIVENLRNQTVCVTLVLKNLRRAEEDSNRIYALISACNRNYNGGFSNITLPKASIRAELWKNVGRRGDVSKDQVQYIEFAGEDLSEYDDVLEQFSKISDSSGIYAVSATMKENQVVRSTGIESLIKSILAVHKAMIPPLLGEEDWEYPREYNKVKIRINQTVTKWDEESLKRRCWLNYYSPSGANYSLILESYSEKDTRRESFLKEQFFCISAVNEEEMKLLVEEIYHDLENRKIDFDDYCFTSTVGQNHRELRYIILVKSKEDLLNHLKRLISGEFRFDVMQDGFYKGYRQDGSYYPESACKLKGIGQQEIERLSQKSRALVSNQSLNSLSLEDKKLLCQYYVEGADIQWRELYQGMQRRLISFARYPSMKANTDRINERFHANPNENLHILGRTGDQYTENERIIAAVVAKVLNLKSISIYDPFIWNDRYKKKESIMLVILNEKLSCKITVQQLRKLSCVYKLAKYIDHTKNTTSQSVPEYYSLSNQQMSILIAQMRNKNSSYNIPRVVLLEGKLDIKRLNDAFQTIINRHDALRTTIQPYHGNYVQKVNQQVNFAIEYEKRMDDEFNETYLKEFIRPFDLSVAPLFRVRVLEFRDDQYVILLDIHHIISDRESINIILKEFAKLYQGYALNYISKPYYSYIQWQKEFMQTEEWKNQEEYWLDQYSEGLPEMNMKTDYEREQFDSFTEATIVQQLSEDMVAKIDAFCVNYKVTANMLMLASYNILLYRWLEEEHLVVGINTIGRNLQGVADTIGMFVNTLAIYSKVSSKDKIIDFIHETKNKLVNAYVNSDYSYEVFMDELRKRNKKQNIALIHTLFVMQNNDYDELHLGNLNIKQYDDYIKTDARFDLQVNVFRTEDKKSNICFIYCKELFKKSTMEKLMNAYLSILDQVLDHSELLIARINVEL